MYFFGTGKKNRVQVDHSFPWDAWVHKSTVLEVGFYAVILGNLEEEILNMALGSGYGNFSDLFMARHLGRRLKK